MSTSVSPKFKRITGFISAGNVITIDGTEYSYSGAAAVDDCPIINLGFRSAFIALSLWPAGNDPTDWNVAVSTFPSASGRRDIDVDFKPKQLAVPVIHDTSSGMASSTVGSTASSLCTGIQIRNAVYTAGTSTGMYFEVIASAN